MDFIKWIGKCYIADMSSIFIYYYYLFMY